MLLEYSTAGTGMKEAEVERQARKVLALFLKEYGTDPLIYSVQDKADDGLIFRVWKLGKMTVRYRFSSFAGHVAISASLEGAKGLPY